MPLPLSVVIPTRNRPQQLTDTLEALATQRLGETGPGQDFDVVVVDDGSSPAAGPSDRLDGRLQVQWLRQEGLGPAAARNRGIKAARGERIVLLGDDTRPADPSTLQCHLDAAKAAHGEGHVGVQGHIDWDPHQPVTPLMDFLAPAGPQFYFVGLQAGQPIPYSAVLGSNYSAPRSWFEAESFDTSFPAAALEDTELAFRFVRRGWQSVYAPKALCWHDHRYDEIGPFLGRQRRAGRAIRHAVRRHPSLLPKLLLEPLAMVPISCLRSLMSRSPQARRHQSWDLRCRLALARGFFGL